MNVWEQGQLKVTKKWIQEIFFSTPLLMNYDKEKFLNKVKNILIEKNKLSCGQCKSKLRSVKKNESLFICT